MKRVRGNWVALSFQGLVFGLVLRVDRVKGESAPWWWRVRLPGTEQILMSGWCRTSEKAKRDAVECARVESRVVAKKKQVLDAVERAMLEEADGYSIADVPAQLDLPRVAVETEVANG